MYKRQDVGTEVLVGGKGAGDKYRIKDDVVTMVHRHIHGTVVTIYTTDVTDTGAGYLSHTYTSQYSDPATGEARGGRSSFKDSFSPLPGNGPWVLAERVVTTEAHGDTPPEARPSALKISNHSELIAGTSRL